MDDGPLAAAHTAIRVKHRFLVAVITPLLREFSLLYAVDASSVFRMNGVLIAFPTPALLLSPFHSGARHALVLLMLSDFTALIAVTIIVSVQYRT